MMNNFLIASILISVLNIISASSKDLFTPGTIFLQNGDSINGLIEDKDWSVNPKSIAFKARPSGEVRNYTPLEIQSFRINGRSRYTSYMGPLDRSSMKLDELDYSVALPASLDTIFLRVLVEGEATLLYCNDSYDRKHFLIQKDDSVTELHYKKYLKTVSGKTITAELETYKIQVTRILSDCEEFSNEIMTLHLSFSMSDLMNAVLRYNKCKKKITYVAPIQKIHVAPVILAGVSTSRLTFKTLEEFSAGPQTGFTGGVGINFILPRNHRRFILYTELFFRSFKAEYETAGTLDLVYLNIPAVGKYEAIQGKTTLTVGGGFVFCTAVKYDFSNSKPYYFNDVYRRIFSPGLIGLVGLRYKGLELEIRGEYSQGVSQWENATSHFTSGYAVIGYRFD
jgi:hypothetical protein